MFETLPWRPIPIYLRSKFYHFAIISHFIFNLVDPDEDSEKNMKATIQINGVDILGNFNGIKYRWETMTWDASLF